jgi:hypothetical protein
MRKKLLLLVAGTSTGLRIDDYGLGHNRFTSRQGKIFADITNFLEKKTEPLFYAPVT